MAATLSACAGSAPLDSVNDPYENFNRKMFAVEQTLDYYVVEPAAKGYNYLPQPVRGATRNVLNNLSSPVTMANDVLQGEVKRFSTTFLRFGINTTLGVFGIFDVARHLGFERHTEDFGQTLAKYGFAPGPYLYVPSLGPSPPRDLLGWTVDWVFDPVTYISDGDIATAFGFYALDGVDLRAANLGIFDEIERSSVDFYATVRSLYRQSRKSEIANGVTDLDDLPDLDALDDLDDLDDF
jgi:phospholipid-binding lipoprotein MlaA